MQSIVLVWLPIASVLFCDLLLANKLGSQLGKGKPQGTDDSILIVIDTCFSLIKPFYSLQIQMWLYHHKIILSVSFCFGINLGEFLAENMIINPIPTNPKVRYKLQLGILF